MPTLHVHKMMTDVVPSPTSSSCDRDNSIMLLAAGWLTSISRRMALPSFVITMPPIGSSSIFSIDRGPSVVRMISDTACEQQRGVNTVRTRCLSVPRIPWRRQCFRAEPCVQSHAWFAGL